MADSPEEFTQFLMPRFLYGSHPYGHTQPTSAAIESATRALFQSEHDWAAWLRDLAFDPLGRMPGTRGEMLKVLSGIKRGWFGSLPLARTPRRVPARSRRRGSRS